MLEGTIPTYRFCCEFLRKQVSQINPDDADVDPTGDLKTPRWQVGHLLVGDLFAAAMIELAVGEPSLESLLPAFGPGSDPHSVPADAPTLAELLAAKSAIEGPLAEAVAAADAGQFTGPHGVEFLSGWPLVSKSDLLAHLLSTHFATDLGELAMWRRARGIPPLF